MRRKGNAMHGMVNYLSFSQKEMSVFLDSRDSCFTCLFFSVVVDDMDDDMEGVLLHKFI